jgi:hypothetical protein
LGCLSAVELMPRKCIGHSQAIIEAHSCYRCQIPGRYLRRELSFSYLLLNAFR